VNSQTADNQRPDIPRRTCAGGAVNFTAAVKNREGRDRANPESLPQLGHRVGVHLHDQPFTGGAFRHLVELGRHHPAGTAPWCPEIDDNRHGRRRDERVERCGIGHFDRLGR
jgi:hypothetical protein